VSIPNETRPKGELSRTMQPSSSSSSPQHSDDSTVIHGIHDDAASSLASPVICMMGHVDAGKTRVLDGLRNTQVYLGEAGGITQQIGMTFVAAEKLRKFVAHPAVSTDIPGVLLLDTPGHDSFSHLRHRGASLCDLVVVDITKGLERCTLESIEALRAQKTPFMIALNKIDRLYGWKPHATDTTLDGDDLVTRLTHTKSPTSSEFRTKADRCVVQLNELGFNAALRWEVPDSRRYLTLVPVSALTGVGMRDLVRSILQLTQQNLVGTLAVRGDGNKQTHSQLHATEQFRASVLEVQQVPGMGATVDCVLFRGNLCVGDEIMACGLTGVISTRVRALKLSRTEGGGLEDRRSVTGTIGVKIVAPGLETALAGTKIFLVPKGCGSELSKALRDQAKLETLKSPMVSDTREGGVCIQASTMGSLEALLAFLSRTKDVSVSAMSIGEVNRKDVMRASAVARKAGEQGRLSAIIAFDVPIAKEAAELARELGVKIFASDVIYRLFDQFVKFVEESYREGKEDARNVAVFPCSLRIVPGCVFNKKDPIVLGVEVTAGVLKQGTPLCVVRGDATSQEASQVIDLGRVESIQDHHRKNVNSARQSDKVSVRLAGGCSSSVSFGRHFDMNDELVSRMTRPGIDALKAHFMDEMTEQDWRLTVKLKRVLSIS